MVVIDHETVLIGVQEKLLADTMGKPVHITPPRTKNGVFRVSLDGSNLCGVGPTLRDAVTDFIANAKH